MNKAVLWIPSKFPLPARSYRQSPVRRHRQNYPVDADTPYHHDGYHHHDGHHHAFHLLHAGHQMVGIVCRRALYFCHGDPQLSGRRQVEPHLLPHSSHPDEFRPGQDSYWQEAKAICQQKTVTQH